MSIQFENTTNTVVFANRWAPTSPHEFEIEVDFTPTGTLESQHLLYEGRSRLRLFNGQLNFGWTGPGSSAKTLYLGDSPAADERVNYRLAITENNSIDFYKNGVFVQTHTIPEGDEIVSVALDMVGRNSGTFGITAGWVIHEIRLLDPQNAANSSVYLFDEGSGTLATDSGEFGNDGTLTNWSDPDGAWIVEGTSAHISFSDGDPETRLRDRDGNFITAADVPIRVSTQRDPRGAPALTGAPGTMSITDGEATLDLSAADPMPTTGDAIYVEVFDQKATPEDDISRRYVLRMQDGATAGE